MPRNPQTHGLTVKSTALNLGMPNFNLTKWHATQVTMLNGIWYVHTLVHFGQALIAPTLTLFPKKKFALEASHFFVTDEP